MSRIANVRQLRTLFSEREKLKFWVLLSLVTIAGFLEMLSIGLLLPLLAIISDPTILNENAYLQAAKEFLPIKSSEAFLALIVFTIFAAVLLGLLIKAISFYAVTKFANMRSYTISSRLLALYLKQDYDWFLNKNTSNITKIVLEETQRVINGTLRPSLQLFSGTALCVSIIGLLLYVDVVAAAFMGLIIAGAYLLIFAVLKPRLDVLSKDIAEANASRFRIVKEATAGIKEVKLLDLERSYLREFDKPANIMARSSTQALIFAQLPRFVLEGVAFISAVLLLIYLLWWQELSASEVLPTVGLFAFAGLRLLPAMQQIYVSATAIRTNAHIFVNLVEQMATLSKALITDNEGALTDGFRGSSEIEISLQDVCYTYPESTTPAIQDVSFNLPAGTILGIVGQTGSGKTTLIDVLLGLLLPTRGRIVINGVQLDRTNLSSWRKRVGYVPQTIFLADDTVRANITFGADDLPTSRRFSSAVEQAEVDEFVSQKLSDGYETQVGELGVMLSGGQRQRLGIARALYRNPSVLVFDEATSALDNITERKIIENISNAKKFETIIMVAHRTDTIKHCDLILFMKDGRLFRSGSYAELLQTCAEFRALVGEKDTEVGWTA